MNNIFLCIVMNDFINCVIKTILEKWNRLSPNEKDKMRDELINTFICFVGDGTQDKKKIIGVHLN